MVFVSNNISLSPLIPSDAEAIVECMRDKEISDNTMRIPYPYSLEEGELWIEDNIIFAEENNVHRNLAIRNEAGTLIGAIGLHFNYGLDGDKSEFGYWLGKAYWNRGIMTEAIKKFCRVAKEDYGMKMLEAYAFDYNIASHKVLTKAGFEKLELIPNGFKKDGRFINAICFKKQL